MGRIVFSGKIETGHPYYKLKEECFMQQVRNNYSWYSGDLGAVSIIKEEDILKNGRLCYEFENYIRKHPELKTKEKMILGYLLEEADYLPDDQAILIYAVDTTKVLGYEIITFGGHQEIPVRQLPETYFRYLNPKNNGYQVFNMTLQTYNKRECSPIEDRRNFSSINEIETFLLSDSYWRRNLMEGQVYFAIKNDGSKAYMIGPKVQFVNSTSRKSNDKQLVRKVHPVIYAAKVSC